MYLICINLGLCYVPSPWLIQIKYIIPTHVTTITCIIVNSPHIQPSLQGWLLSQPSRPTPICSTPKFPEELASVLACGPQLTTCTCRPAMEGEGEYSDDGDATGP